MKKFTISIVSVWLCIFLSAGMGYAAENLSVRVFAPSIVSPGDEITYTIIYLNEGDTRAQDVEIVHVLPQGNYTYVSSFPAGVYSSVNNSVTWNKTSPGMAHLESLGAGARTINVTVKAGVQGGTPGFASAFSPLGYFIDAETVTLQSYAQVSSLVHPIVQSNTVETIVNQVCSALLNIAEGEIKSSTGTPVVYLVQVINSGNVYNKFDLSATNYQCGSLSFDPLYWRFLDIQGNVITTTNWLAPGESFLLLFEVSCPPGSNPFRYSCHTVFAQSVVCNNVSAVEHTQTQIVQSPKYPMILLAKVSSRDVVQSGDTLVYSIYSFNSNDSYPANNFSITDVIPDNVTYVSHRVEQTNSTLVSDSYNPTTKTLSLLFSTLTYGTANAINVYVYTVVNDIASCNDIFSNTAYATYSGASQPKFSTKTVSVLNKPDLVLTKKAKPNPDPAQPLGTIEYTLVYENIGNCAATNIQITDFYDNIHTTDGGANTGVKTFGTYSLAPGEKDSVQYTVTMMGVSEFPDGTTTILNVATIQCDEPELDYNNNTASASVYVEILPDLVVTKTVNAEPGNILEVGKNYTYTITVVNIGDIEALQVTIYDTIPQGFALIEASGGGVEVGNVIVWPTIASLAPNSLVTVTCTFEVDVTCSALGEVTNVAYAYSITNDSNEDNNIAYSTSLVVDNQLPEITCAVPALNYVTGIGGCTYTVSGIDLDPISFSDNCTVKSVSNSYTNTASLALAEFDLGTTIVNWTVIDESDNQATCSQTIVVVDNQNPTIVCAADMVLETNIACSYSGAITLPVIADNCTSVDNIVLSNNAPVQFDLGQTTVTWLAEDASGNTASCNQLITVIDVQNPIALSSNFSINLSPMGTAVLTPLDIDNGSYDNCMIDTMFVSKSDFSCADVGTHQVLLTVVDDSGNTASSTSTVTVLDPDMPGLSMNAVTVTEGVDMQAVVRVTMSHARSCDVSFTIHTIDGSANHTLDYVSLANQVYTIPAGETYVDVMVEIVNDAVTEPTESLFVQLSNAEYAFIQTSQIELTILDDDASTISIGDVTVAETDGIVSFNIVLQGAIQHAVSFDYATNNLTALSGSDYIAKAGVIVFDAGSASGTVKQVNIDIVNDIFAEPTESFQVLLTNLQTVGSVTFAKDIAVGTITDEDGASIAINDRTVNESVSEVIFSVTLTGNIQDAVSVDFATVNGTAMAGSDFVANAGTLEFAAGSFSGATKTISIQIINDTYAEPTETYSVVLSNLQKTGNIIVSKAIGLGSIVDNDVVSVSIANVTVHEYDLQAQFVVTLTGSTQDAVSVNYTTQNGTALAGNDYVAQAGVITFAAGSVNGSQQIISIPIVQNSFVEPTETFSVVLSNIQSLGLASIVQSIGVGTIIDDDAASVSVQNIVVQESDGVASFTISLHGDIENAVTVSYNTSNLTATSGLDYVTKHGSVTFPALSTDGATITVDVDIINDNLVEPTEKFLLILSNLQAMGAVSISTAQAECQILDNDDVSVTINNVTVLESAGTANFLVMLTGNIQDALMVEYSTSSVSAISGVDYVAKSGLVTFPAGSLHGSVQSVSIAIINDNVVEPTEVFHVMLSNIVSTGSAAITHAQGVGTITDNDAASIAINNVSVSELDGLAVFAVQLTGAIQEALTVDYNTIDGEAVSGLDYTSASGTITFPAGSTQGTVQTISVTIINDAIAEPNETFTVLLTNLQGQGSITMSKDIGVATIIDNNSVSIAIQDVAVLESDGVAIFNVVLIGDLQDELTVDFTTVNGTALAGQDYVLQSGTVTFPDNSVSGTIRTISIDIVDDNVVEPLENFSVQISNIQSVASATIIDDIGICVITDNDNASVSIANVSVLESDGVAEFVVSLQGNVQEALFVDYASLQSSALSISDFISVSGSLEFPAGSVDGTVKSIFVTVVDDNLVEPTEEFFVNISNVHAAGNVSVSNAHAVGIIVDNDVASVSIADVTVQEQDGVAVVAITLTGNVQNEISIAYNTTQQTALAGVDYQSKTGTVVFPAMSTNGALQFIEVVIHNDDVTESTENFIVALHSLVSAGAVSISKSESLITILDNDVSSVAINNVTSVENSGTAIFTVTLSGSIQDALTVDFETLDVTAIAGSDYIAKNGVVLFDAGSLHGVTRSIEITILDDNFSEPTETYQVVLTNVQNTGSASISQAIGIGTILDDAENDRICIAIQDVLVNEDDGLAVFNIVLTGNTQDAVTVDYTTVAGSALPVVDYIEQVGSVVFEPGSTTGTIKTVNVVIVDDVITEPTESMMVHLTNVACTGASSVSQDKATATILDNDVANISISSILVSEDVGSAVFTVTLSGSIQDALLIDFATANTTAMSVSDYVAKTGTIEFPANSVDGTTRTISVQIVNDLIAEPTETFRVLLSNIQGSGNVSILQTVGVCTITDNDVTSVAINQISVNESVGNAVFTVTLTGSIQDALSLSFTTQNGTALAGGDYVAQTGTVNFAAGSTHGATRTISITIVNDASAEPVEQFTVVLSNLQSTANASISNAVGVCEIVDNDVVTVSINNITVNEPIGTAMFTVTLQGAIQDALHVDFMSNDGTAKAGSDYVATSGSLTFNAGSSNGAILTIPVQIINDAVTEPTEEFTVVLSNIQNTGSASILKSIGKCTILDDAIGDAVSVAIGNVVVTESDNQAVFTVVLTGNIQDELRVDYASSNVTATHGEDFTVVSGTLIFEAGSTNGAIKNISVPILHDNIAEPIETYHVTLSNIQSTGVATISNAVALGTIIDDDAASISIQDVTVSETDGVAVFVVTLSGNVQDAVSVNFATENSSALAGSDYVAKSGVITFEAGSVDGTQKEISISIINDSYAEPTETFRVILANLQSIADVSISKSIGIGTILDDIVGDAVSIAINDVTASEGSGSAVFTVTLTGNIQDALVVNFATHSGSALPNRDYTHKEGLVTFAAGSLSGATQSITVSFFNDAIAEPTETYQLVLQAIQFNGTASFTKSVGVGTIIDDDAVEVRIDDVEVVESDGVASFVVRLVGNIQDELSCNYSTVDVTALDGSDYFASSGQILFDAGSINGSVRFIHVPLVLDEIAEPTETFQVVLSNLINTANASITDNIGVATILDDDAYTISIAGITVTETNVSEIHQLLVTMSGIAQEDVELLFTTANGNAFYSQDYTSQISVSYTIPAGSTSINIPIEILGDLISEPTETFTGKIELLEAYGQQVSIATSTALITILDDDIADLQISKVSSPTVAVAGKTITYTITVQNNGTNIAQNVAVTDVFPDEVSFVNAVAQVGEWNAPIWTIGSMNPNTSVVLTLSGVVKPTMEIGEVISNTATVTSSTHDPNVQNNIALVSNIVNVQTDLAITKTILTNPVQVGQPIVYEITVSNNGPSNAVGVRIVEIPVGISQAQYSLNNGGTWNTWISPHEIPMLLNGESKTMLLRGTVFQNQCDDFVNQAEVISPNSNDPILANNIASVTASPVDIIAPTIVCPAQVQVNTDLGDCFATGVELGVPSVQDNCSIASVVNNAVEPFAKGETTVVWTVTDATNNTASCTQKVIVLDNEQPAITCAVPQETYLVNNGVCTYTHQTADLNPLVSDNCAVVSLTNTFTNSGTLLNAIFPLGKTSVIWKAIDAAGNEQSCMHEIMVVDTELPTIICPPKVTVNTDENKNTASNVLLGVPNVSDNCSITSITNDAPSTGLLGSIAESHIFNFGITEVIWTVVDGFGNSASCLQIVEVVDNQIPTIVSCPSNITVVADAGLCTASDVNLGVPIVTDNIEVVAIEHNAPTVFSHGQTVVTWLVRDDANNETTCSQTVTVTSAPFASNDTYVTNEDETLDMDVLINDTDCADAIQISSLSIVQQPVHGTLQVNTTTGIINYTPDANYFGDDMFVYRICNSGVNAMCSNASVYITVLSVNDAPILVDIDTITKEDTPVTIDVASRAIDIDGTIDIASIDLDIDLPGQQVMVTEQGVWEVSSLGLLTYSPARDFVGVASIQLTIRDNDGAVSNVVTVTVDVYTDIYKVWELIIPQGFSPNNDGVNDVFEIKNLDKYPNNSIVVFNRWGSVVYQAKPYPNNWDGTTSFGISVGGNDLPVGTYFYIIDIGDGSELRKGFIYISK